MFVSSRVSNSTSVRARNVCACQVYVLRVLDHMFTVYTHTHSFATPAPCSLCTHTCRTRFDAGGLTGVGVSTLAHAHTAHMRNGSFWQQQITFVPSPPVTARDDAMRSDIHTHTHIHRARKMVRADDTCIGISHHKYIIPHFIWALTAHTRVVSSHMQYVCDGIDVGVCVWVLCCDTMLRGNM